MMELLPYHIALMSAAFTLALAGGLVARFARPRRWWLKTHRNVNGAAALLAAAGISVAVLMVRSYEGSHFSSPHGILGLAAGVGLVVQALGGWFMSRPPLSSYGKSLRPIHRRAGWLLMLAMAANIALGLGKVL